MSDDALALLFRRLVIAAQQADALARPIEVGEILETLVPYRSARRDGLLDTNDDYLHALMQLLAGEGGYIFTDDLMQDDLKNELTALNPDLGALNTYRTAKVRIASTPAAAVLAGDTNIDLRPATPTAPRGVQRSSGESVGQPRLSPAVATKRVSAEVSVSESVSASVSVPSTSPVSPMKSGPAATSGVASQGAPLPVVESAASVCPYCSKDITTDRALKYCPHCGINLRIRRCPGCSAEMEAEWKFCVTCGRSAA